MYILMKPQDISVVWKTKALSFDPIVEWGLVAIFGMSPDTVQRMHLDDADGTGSMYVNSHTFFRDHLSPGKPLETITGAFVQHMIKDLEAVKRAIREAPGGKIQVGLMSWIRQRVGIPSTNALAGEGVVRHDPGILEALSHMDADLFRLSSGLPKWINKDAHDNVQRLTDAFERGMEPETSIYWAQKRMKMMADRDISSRDQFAAVMSLWQACVSCLLH